MTNAVGILNDELRTALQNVSGKTIDGNFQTTAEMLHAFNGLYVCKTKFDVVDSEAAPVTDATITVKSGDTIIEPNDDGKYSLGAGSYKYDCAAEGYTAVTDVAFTISASDVTRGSKSITVTLTAATE